MRAYLTLADFVDPALQFAAEHRAWTYALAFLLAMAEALPVIGMIVPGSIIIIGLGALVPGGALNLWHLLAWSTFGAITGSGVSYWLGRYYHEEIPQVWPFRRYPMLISRGESLLRAHGRKAVFMSRFAQVPRAFVPLAAGILGMPAHRFFPVNILSAVIWAPSHILAGALLGGSLVLAGAVAGRLAMILVLTLLLVWSTVWLAGRGLRVAPRIWPKLQERVLAWAHARNSAVRRQVAALLDPNRPETTALMVLSVILVGAAWLFLGVLEDVVTGDPLVRADTAVYHFLQSLRTPWVDQLFIAVTELGDNSIVVAVAATVLLWLAIRRAWRAAAYLLSGLVLTSAFGTLLKLALHRPRPTAVYEGWSAYAFPSGHASMSAFLWGFLCILIAREATRPWWPWTFGAGAMIVSLIAFSRLYLGVHWFSDVVGGLAFGIVWAALLSVAYLRRAPQRAGGIALATVAFGAFLVAGAVHIDAKFPEDAHRYAVRASPVVISIESWGDARWRDLPTRRMDMEGEYEEPLTIQWAGDLDRLKEILLGSGWRTPTPWSARSALSWLSPQIVGDALPVLPKLHDGHPAALTLIRAKDGLPSGVFRLVLRFWDSGVRLPIESGPPRVLWIGAAVSEAISTPVGLLSITRTTDEFDEPLAAFRESLEPDLFVMRSRETRMAGWDGQVILADTDAGFRPER